MLNGKHIIIGVTGSIAAYKTASLIRLLVRQGAEVKVIMTPLAKEFITPLTLATLSRNPILIDFFNPENGDWNSHVDLGLWADAYVIAPATANTLAKMAHGVADNLLLTTYLSARCPVVVAPAMDVDMFCHASTQANLNILRGQGVHVVEPLVGELASGLEGKGRMEEPEGILASICMLLNQNQTLAGKRVLVTSGPTQESIDPVRYIGNHSSGKMGYCMAMELAHRGAEVVFITGPAERLPLHPNIQVEKVTTAQEMYLSATHHFPSCSSGILAAAVADYRPKVVSENKIKRTGQQLTIELEPTHDIACTLGKSKQAKQVLVGFALETDNATANALRKLRDKNLDFIVLNVLGHEGAGFGIDTNRITIIRNDGSQTPYPVMPKSEVAKNIVDELARMILPANQV